MEGTQIYISENKERFVSELIDLLKLPSVSADPAFSGDVVKTAEMIAKRFKGSRC